MLKKPFTYIPYSICFIYEHFDWLLLSFHTPYTNWLLFALYSGYVNSSAYSGISFLIFLICISELFIWRMSNSWCSVYARLRIQISVCLYQLKISYKLTWTSCNSEMHFETNICLSSLLLWKTPPEEPGLTPKPSPSLLEGTDWSTLLHVSPLTMPLFIMSPRQTSMINN